LAERRLGDLKGKIGALRISDDADLNFEQVAKYWNEATKHTIASGTLARRNSCIKNLSEFFKDTSIRNIEVRDCEQWAASRGGAVAAQTFAHELDTMKAVFKYAVVHGLILANPAASIKRKKISNRKMQTPSREQFQQIVAEIRKSDGRSDSQEKAKDGADLIEFLGYSNRVPLARSQRRRSPRDATLWSSEARPQRGHDETRQLCSEIAWQQRSNAEISDGGSWWEIFCPR